MRHVVWYVTHGPIQRGVILENLRALRGAVANIHASQIMKRRNLCEVARKGKVFLLLIFGGGYCPLGLAPTRRFRLLRI